MRKELKLMLEYTKNLEILYVDDDKMLVEGMLDLFSNYFDKVDVAYDGEEGVEQYKSFYETTGKYYDLVISDINMPKMNGIEMCEQILKLEAFQSIIIISAHNEIEYLSKAIDMGVDGFLTKPMDNEALMRVLYKTAQAISDHKFVEEHVGQIEELNIQLEVQNKELLTKNLELEKSFRMLDTMVDKEKMINPIKESNEEENVEIDQILIDQIQHLINDDLEELQEIHSEIDLNVIHIIHSIDFIDEESLIQLVKQFSKYASILSFYSFFDQLSSSMANFSVTLKENPLPENKDSIQNIFMLLESFMYVLGKWQGDLASQESTKINSLDASIISDMHTITNMWTQKEEEVSDNDLDDIFDF